MVWLVCTMLWRLSPASSLAMSVGVLMMSCVPVAEV